MGVQQEELRVIKPLIEQRADPFICRHSDGYYYFVASVPEYNRIEIRRAQDLEGLITSAPIVIWRKRETGILSANIWAPELHFIDGKWYVYFAAAHTSETTEGLFDHRMYVLENENTNPLEGSWTERGQVRTAWESFSSMPLPLSTMVASITYGHKRIRKSKATLISTYLKCAIRGR